MTVLNSLDQKPLITYPCRWVYKVIGINPHEIRTAIAQTIQDKPYTLSHSNSSKTGKYHCLNLEMMINDEITRTAIYQTLKEHPAIKIVL